MKLPSISQVYEEARGTLARFPFVICSAILATAAALILADHTGPAEPTILFNIFFAGVLGIPLLLTLALVAERKNLSGQSALWMQGLGILVLVGYAFTIPTSFAHSPLVTLWRFFVLVAALHFLVSVAPYATRGEWNGFWHYNKTLFLRLLTSLLYAHILYTGLAIALAALDNLFGVDVPGRRYAELWILTSMMFTTWFFLAGIPDNLATLESSTDYPKTLKILAQYILLPIVLLYFLILYAYLAKIVINWDWPKGWVSKLILGFSATGMFSLLLLRPLAGQTVNAWAKKAEYWFYIVLVPLIVMLFLAVWRRVGEYGITEGRYLALALGVWLLFLVAYFTLSKQKSIKIIPASLCLAAFAVSFGPWGTFAVSRTSQISRLERITTEHGILVDGRIHPVHQEVPFAASKQISSILDYLSENHGYDAIQKWFDVSLRDSTSTFRGRGFKSAEAVAKQMGLIYVPPWRTAQEQNVISFEADGAFGPQGYERVANVSWYKRTDTLTADGISYHFGEKDSLSFSSVPTSQQLLFVDLHRHTAGLVKKYTSPTTNLVPAEEMAVAATAPGLKVKLCPWRLEVKQIDGKVSIMSMEAILLYSIEQKK
jgi:hypothetical protein